MWTCCIITWVFFQLYKARRKRFQLTTLYYCQQYVRVHITKCILLINNIIRVFPGGCVGKEPPFNPGDTRNVDQGFPREGNGNPLHYSCLGNTIDRRVWQATVHGVTRSWTRMSTHNNNISVWNDQNS